MKKLIVCLLLLSVMASVSGCNVLKALEHPNGHSSHGGGGYGGGGGHNH